MTRGCVQGGGVFFLFFSVEFWPTCVEGCASTGSPLVRNRPFLLTCGVLDLAVR